MLTKEFLFWTFKFRPTSPFIRILRIVFYNLDSDEVNHIFCGSQLEHCLQQQGLQVQLPLRHMS